jgi:hypothetical protein
MWLISIEPSDMISILAPVWRQVHGAIIVKPQVSVTQLTVLTISHHTPPLQNQVRRFYFSFTSFTWFLGLSHKNQLLPTHMKPQRWLMIRLKRIYNFLCSMLVYTPFALCFVYTSWHFYAFSGTNLLTRWHSANSLFSAVFVFHKSYTGNILRIGWKKSWSS